MIAMHRTLLAVQPATHEKTLRLTKHSDFCLNFNAEPITIVIGSSSHCHIFEVMVFFRLRVCSCPWYRTSPLPPLPQAPEGLSPFHVSQRMLSPAHQHSNFCGGGWERVDTLLQDL